MESRHFTVVSFVLACFMLHDTRPHSVSGPTHWGVEVQQPAAEAEREHSSQSARQAGWLQSKHMQPTVKPFTWKFPEDPADPVRKLPVEFKLQQPVAANTVAVRCGESKINVEMSQDLLGLGKRIKPEEISLGGCSVTEVDDLSHVLAFESELHGCGSTLVMTENSFIYAFTLVFNPEVFGRSQITRSQRAVIGVECHYPRKHSMSSSLLPAGMSDKNTAGAEKQVYFSLQLMTDDWKFERTYNKYALGDVINMQASVVQDTQPPRRVLVDSCVATLKPDSASEPRRAFIKNSGCLGGRHTGSRSKFMHQSQPDKLQFQVEAHSLRPLKTMYISCQLKAIPASSPVTIERKACHFEEGWKALSGKDAFCVCCEATCGMRKIRGTTEEQWEAEVTVGPIVVE